MFSFCILFLPEFTLPLILEWLVWNCRRSPERTKTSFPVTTFLSILLAVNWTARLVFAAIAYSGRALSSSFHTSYRKDFTSVIKQFGRKLPMFWKISPLFASLQENGQAWQIIGSRTTLLLSARFWASFLYPEDYSAPPPPQVRGERQRWRV